MPVRTFKHPERAKVRAHVARLHGVTEEHLLETIENRRRAKRAREERRRSRRRVLARNHGVFKSRKSQPGPLLFAGEGRFTELLKIAGMTEADFAKLAGMSIATIKAWYGFPLHGWPIVLLESHVHGKRMAEFLASKGWDPEKFKPGTLPLAPDGHYPRTTEQGKEVIKNAERATGRQD